MSQYFIYWVPAFYSQLYNIFPITCMPVKLFILIQKSSITKLLVKTLLFIIIDSDLKIYQRGNTVLCIRVSVLVSSEPWKEPSNHFIVIFYSKAILLNFFQVISGRISDQNLPMLLYREGNHKSGLHFVSGYAGMAPNWYHQ